MVAKEPLLKEATEKDGQKGEYKSCYRVAFWRLKAIPTDAFRGWNVTSAIGTLRHGLRKLVNACEN